MYLIDKPSLVYNIDEVKLLLFSFQFNYTVPCKILIFCKI